jgi:hypothetical protein
MARPMKLDIEGGWYYVVNQGIEIPVISEVVPEEHFIELSAQLLGSIIPGAQLLGQEPATAGEWTGGMRYRR